MGLRLLNRRIVNAKRSVRRRRGLALLAMAAATACGAPTRPVVAPVSVAPRVARAPDAPPTTHAPSVVPAPTGSAGPRTEPIAPAACVLEAEPWLADDQAELRLRPGGTPFVHVGVNVARVQVPVSDPLQSVFVELSRLGWHVAGHLDAGAFSVYPARVLTFHGFLIPTEFASLAVVRAEPGELVLNVAPPPLVTLAASLPPAPASCRDVGLEPPWPLDAERFLAGDAGSRPRAYLAKRRVALRVDPYSDPIAWLGPTEEREQVHVLEKRGAYARVVLLNHTTLVFGWVQARDLQTPRARVAEEYGIGGLGMAGSPSEPSSSSQGKPPSDRTAYRCNAEVPLWVDVHGERMQVGSIDPGTRLETAERSGGRAELVPPKYLTPSEGATFDVAESELAHCERLP
jgi:hypothetical protein